jgi:hypothetical protein
MTLPIIPTMTSMPLAIDQLFLAWRMAQNTIVTLASQSNSL